MGSGICHQLAKPGAPDQCRRLFGTSGIPGKAEEQELPGKISWRQEQGWAGDGIGMAKGWAGKDQEWAELG